MTEDVKKALDELKKIEAERVHKEEELKETNQELFEINSSLQEKNKKLENKICALEIHLGSTQNEVETYELELASRDKQIKELEVQLENIYELNSKLAEDKKKSPISLSYKLVLVGMLVVLLALISLNYNTFRLADSRYQLIMGLTKKNTSLELQNEKLLDNNNRARRALNEITNAAVDCIIDLEKCESSIRKENNRVAQEKRKQKAEQKAKVLKNKQKQEKKRQNNLKRMRVIKRCDDNDPLGCLLSKKPR
jgi:hypothetical protein